MHNNLLIDPIFSVRMGEAKEELSLPQVLEAMGAGRDLEFSMLRRHQHHAWFSFLVQLGAIVSHRFGHSSPELSADVWAQALLELGGDEEAWWLVVDDLSKPAFMQPPVPEGNLSGFKDDTPTPDALDVLIVGRNHDLKQTTMRNSKAEHWVYSMVSLQTTQGFLGVGNFGISRMNGGFSSRPSVGTTIADDWGVRFLQDLSALLQHRIVLCGENWPFLSEEGVSLLWTLVWDGTTSLSLSKLDPLYIEVCRRIRLTGSDPCARVTGSKCARLATKERFGDTGDFWTPLNRADRKSLTVQATGLTYKLISDIAFGPDWILAPAQIPGESTINKFVARVLVRGQGKTGGYHERVIPIPGKARKFFAKGGSDTVLGKRSREMVELASTARLKVLKTAVLVLGQGAPEKLNFKDSSYDSRLAEFDLRVDAFFFTHLFENVEMSEEDARTEWHKRLWSEVEELFLVIANSIPSPIARQYKARAQAERALYGSARKHLSHAFEKESTNAREA